MTEKDEDMLVTPWEVQGTVDYDKLMERFGTQKINEELLERIKKHAGELHYALRRGHFFSHRDMDWLLDMLEKGTPFVLYTGRGPSDSVHVAHYFIWKFAKWLQDVFDVELYFQVTDDEKFFLKRDRTLDYMVEHAYENMKDVMAIGFDPKKTHFILDTMVGPEFIKLTVEVAKRVTFSTVKAVFGFDNSTNIGMIHFPAVQAAPCFYPSVVKGKKTPVLIPAAIDQDPYWRITRDVAERMGYFKPAAIHSRFVPGLTGDEKMAASDQMSALYTTDTPKLAKKKVMNAFTGGQTTVEEQRQLGANPDICAVFAYFNFIFEEDDEKLAERQNACRSGELLCGHCKKELANRVVCFLKEHQAKREEFASIIPDLILRV